MFCSVGSYEPTESKSGQSNSVDTLRGRLRFSSMGTSHGPCTSPACDPTLACWQFVRKTVRRTQAIPTQKRLAQYFSVVQLHYNESMLQNQPWDVHNLTLHFNNSFSVQIHLDSTGMISRIAWIRLQGQDPNWLSFPLWFLFEAKILGSCMT